MTDEQAFEALAEAVLSIETSLKRIANTLKEQTALVRRQTILTESAHEIAERSEAAREELLKLSKKNLDLQEDFQKRLDSPKEPWQGDQEDAP